MLPNRFPDEGGEAEYNTVDATLWYFEAVRAYVESTGDVAFVRKQLYAKLSEIITWHLRGTRYNIHVDTDGLLYAGDAGEQLTWMDAKVGGIVITPRTGKPVEIEALWYNALRTMQRSCRAIRSCRRYRPFSLDGRTCKAEFQLALLERRCCLSLRRGREW